MTLPGLEEDSYDADGREVILRFRAQDDGRMRSTWAGRVVVAGREYEKSAQMKDGEHWRVVLHDEIVVIVAEPVALESPAPPTHRGRRGDAPASKPPMSPTPAPEPVPAPPPVSPDADPGLSAPPLDRPEDPPLETDHPPSAPPEPDLPPSLPPMRLHGADLEPEDVIRPDERVAFFIDASNLYFAARDLDLEIDWNKLIDFLIGNARFADAYFYVPGNFDPGFLERLAHSGYTIRRKAIKIINDRTTGEKIVKANLDTEIIIDMLTTAPTFDVAYLVSGDSDFERVIDYLRQRGRRVYVVSSRNTLSRELAMCANKPIYHLENFGVLFSRIPTPKNQEEMGE